MGNIQHIISSLDDNQKLEFLIKEGLICDELISLFRDGSIPYKCIETYVLENISHNTKYNK